MRDIWDVWNRGQNGSRSPKQDFHAGSCGSASGRFFNSPHLHNPHPGLPLEARGFIRSSVVECETEGQFRNAQCSDMEKLCYSDPGVLYD